MRSGWKVFFEGNCRRARAGKTAGEELRMDRMFCWHGLAWHIPAVYRCRRGMVVDFAVEVPEPEFRAFLERWGIDGNGECRRSLSRAEERQLEQENPMSFDFSTSLKVNGALLRSASACGTGYVPGDAADGDALAWLDHYGLDRTKVWRFWRQSYRWATDSRRSCPKRLRQMELHLEARTVELPLETFRTPAEGEAVTLHLPGQKTCQLTVLEAADEVAPVPPHEGWEFPDHVCRMSYTLTPELSAQALWLYDCADGDRPRRRPHPLPPISPERAALAEKYGLEAPDDGAIAIIGGADGPTAVFWTVRQPEGEEKRVHTVCSASHFAPVQPEAVTWQAVCCKKPCEDGDVSLI